MKDFPDVPMISPEWSVYRVRNMRARAEVRGIAPLYVCRPVVNAWEVFWWFKDQGWEDVIDPDQMHVTIVYSRAPVDWDDRDPDYRMLEVRPLADTLLQFGEATVMPIKSDDLHDSWQGWRNVGASWDHDQYQPHLTLSYLAPDNAADAVLPPFPILLGPEVYAPILDNVEHVHKGNINQPRDQRGRWTIGGGFGGALGGMKNLFGNKMVPANQVKQQPTMDNPNWKPAFEDHLSPKAALAGMAAENPMAVGKDPIYAPHLGNKEGIVALDPTSPTPIEYNSNADEIATYVNGANPGDGLNGIPFKPWKNPNYKDKALEGTFDEPPINVTTGKRLGAGVIVEEPDGRVWVIEPTNHFGGYEQTFPKGGMEKGETLRQAAIKEAHEESGLKIQLTGHLGDYERTTSYARYYTAKRVGGDPTDYHYETQATSLVPKGDLRSFMTHPKDAPILADYLGDDLAIVKALLLWSDGTDEQIEKAAGGGWKKQLRVPAGSKKGGEWTSYGSGKWGAGMAEVGNALDLQKLTSANMQHPQVVKGNSEIKSMEDWANGKIVSSKTADWVKAKAEYDGPNGYSKKVAQSAKEALAYQNAKAEAGQPHNAPAKPQTPKAGATEPAGTYKDPLQLSAMTKVGAKPGGSAAGAIFEDASGQRWLVKSYKTETQASNEVIASKLYNQMGVDTPEMKLINVGDQFNGGIAVASKMLPEATTVKFDPNNPKHIKAAQDDFAAHALVSNWDAVGLSYDNLMVNTETGKTIMVDPGGSLLYRAQGTPKGDLFADKVTEIDTLRDASLNPTAAKVFGGMTESEIQMSMQHALNGLGEGDVIAYTGKYGNTPSMEMIIDQKMTARIADLQSQSDNLVAKSMATEALDISKTGVEAPGKVEAPTAGVAAMLQLDAKKIEDYVNGDTAVLKDYQSQFSGASGDFYVDQVGKLDKLADAGDIQGVQDALFSPKSGTAKLSTNYGIYQKAHAQAVAKAESVKALQLKGAPVPDGNGGLVTGQNNVTAAQVKTAKAMPKYDEASMESWTDAMTASVADQNTQKPVPSAPIENLGVLPAAPTKPNVTTASNPNVKLNKQLDVISDSLNSSLDGLSNAQKIAKIEAVAADIKGSNTYAKKAKKYAADAVASLGGQVAKEQTPVDALKVASKAGLKASTRAHTDAVKETSTTALGGLGDFEVVRTTTLTAFDPKNLTKPPDFANWNGAGNGLSSKPELNASNDANTASMYNAAAANDLATLKAIQPTASQHTQKYKATLIAELEAVGKKSYSYEVKGDVPVSQAINAVGKAFPVKPPYEAGLSKVGAYVKLGESPVPGDVIKKTMPQFDLKKNADLSQSIYEASIASVAKNAATTSIKQYTGSGYGAINQQLRYGVPESGSYQNALKLADKITKSAVPMPAGAVLTRKLQLGSSDISALKKSIGSIIQEPGVGSFSYDAGSPSWSGNVFIRATVAEGAKGIYVGIPPKSGKALSVNAGEREMVIPPNHRMLIVNVSTGAEARKTDPLKVGYDDSHTVVDVILLPMDEV